MTAASKYGSLWKLHCRDSLVRQARFPWREADALEEELGKRTREGRRGMGPGDYTRVAEITSGRTTAQQGLATTCKDLVHDLPGGTGRAMVWRMSPYEQRRRGNALPD